VLDARDHVTQESEKWQRVANFFERFERDVRLAAPRTMRTAAGTVPAWHGRADATTEPRLEFSRFASAEGLDTARRLGYRLNDQREIELWLWPGLDAAPNAAPARHSLLAGVTAFELQYLNGDLAWVTAWPAAAPNLPLPRAVQVRIVLASGEELVRIFALNS
jgi:general secretion pathway protein J